MSWHFSNALIQDYVNSHYSQGQEGGYSVENCLDGELFAQWKSTPSAQDDSCSAKMKDTFHRSPYGMMYVPSTDGHGRDLLMWFLVDFLAKTSVAPEKVPELKENDQDCGQKWPVSLARYDRASRGWKTHQQSLFGGSVEYSGTWPEWGMMHDGEFWALKTPVAIMQGKGSGALPTPTATDWKGGTNKPQKRNGKLRTHQLRSWCKIHFGLTYPIPEHSEAMMGWPVGWTDSAPLETDKFQQWLDSHGKY